MALKLFELVGTDETRPFSPFCWRTRMALAHKGLSAQSIPWCFTEKDAIAPHRSEKVPVLIDGETSVADSWAIANYLEDKYPDRPSLFGGEGGRAIGRMMNWWGDIAVIGGMFPLIVADIASHLKPVDAAYFRRTREARFGKPLEEVVAGRDRSVEGFSSGAGADAADAENTGLSRRRCAELRRLHRVRWLPVGARGQPVQTVGRGRPGLCVARKAARRVRRHGAQVAGLSGVAGPVEADQK
jgi:glutathione S-transferase